MARAKRGRFAKVSIITLSLFAVTVLCQAIYFRHTMSGNGVLEKADLIVVFSGAYLGSQGRIKTGYQLARKGYASNVAISGASKNCLEKYEKRYKIPSHVYRIINGPSITTFQDALCTKEIVEKYGFRSVILVTSSYHMPRSYLLLYTLLAGSGVKIQTYLVSIEDDQSLRIEGLSNKGKFIYNEMVKCWTSAGEMIFYKITGGLFRAKSGIQSTIKTVKSWILFAPPHPSLK
ncbi:MAG: YdcF family protein [Desulfobacterales bacterium]|nr:YdcF family protein [Desulfobacterales bacterium]